MAEATARACPYCDAPLTNPRRVQCGATECTRLHRNANQRAFQRRHVAEHGRSYVEQRYRQQRRATSRTYLAETVTYTCKVCTAPYRARRKQGYDKRTTRVCSTWCVRRLKAGAWPASPVPETHPLRSSPVPSEHGARQVECRGCGLQFIRTHPEQWRCTRACGRNDHWFSPSTRTYIYDRDRWRCQLCGKRIDSRRRGTMHDLAPSIDHIVPRAHGGTHELANLQAAHRICNARKSDRLAGDQLALLG